MVMIQSEAVTKTKLWCAVLVVMALMMEAAALNGPNVCMVQQKYNITKRVKYRAPTTVRTYEWCFSMPPRCSKWKTEMRELTKLETDERIAEVAVCCPGYKMKEVSCVPVCPNGKTGHRCSDDCPPNKWGPNCVNDCEPCNNSGTCSPITGDCSCQEGWQGESCEIRMQPSTTTTTTAEDLLTKAATKPTLPSIPSSRPAIAVTTSPRSLTTQSSRSAETSIRSSETTATGTTLLEHSTRLNRSNTIIESSVLNKTTFMETTSLPSKNTLLETTTSAKATLKPPKTIKETSSFGIKSVISSVTTVPSTYTIADSTVRKVVATTLKPISTTMETVTLLSTTEVTTTKASEVISKTITTTLPTFQEPENTKSAEKSIPTTTESVLISTIQSNLANIATKAVDISPIEKMTTKTVTNLIYNHTEDFVPSEKSLHEQKVPVKVTSDTKIKVEVHHSTGVTIQPKTRIFNNVTDGFINTTPFIITTSVRTSLKETTKRPESTIRYFPTTVKFKPKEIWIRPAQKGESFMNVKTETNHELQSKQRVVTSSTNTTPKTIIVSIIPTSVSYATFKKIAFTTASSYLKNMTVVLPNRTAEQEVTRPISSLTTTELSPTTMLSNITRKFLLPSKLDKMKHISKSGHIDRTSKTISTSHTTRDFSKNKTVSKNGTNSMTTVEQILNSSNFFTTSSTNAIRSKTEQTTSKSTKSVKVTKHPFIQIDTVKRNVTIITVSGKNKNETVVKITKTIAKDVEKTNATRIKDITKTNPITESPEDEEKFHILTEPEHITAVMEGKEKERTSVDLISVISIAGGIMMAVITVAVIIVMVERCKRPRYDDVRKMNDIRMQVMIDNNDVPPPYVRSIFHTPLPDPPSSDKCHYQPISTLDRNLKQFMRPVVVQTISPIMLENFRGILECHYDHLPRRSHNFEPIQRHSSIAPSVDEVDELTRHRPCSEMDSTIEALKCEARLDVIDSTTSEPLYAEIPCWRPPSEHAIEILNLNGEAVTEL